jgi:hypothetical protein
VRLLDRWTEKLALGYANCRANGDIAIDRHTVENTPCITCGGSRMFIAMRHRDRGTYIGLAGCPRCRSSEEV